MPVSNIFQNWELWSLQLGLWRNISDERGSGMPFGARIAGSVFRFVVGFVRADCPTVAPRMSNQQEAEHRGGLSEVWRTWARGYGFRGPAVH